MRNNKSVRRPQLAHSSLAKDGEALSIGDTLRKAKKDLFFSRCVYGMLIVLIITAIIALVYLGYAERFVEQFLDLMQ